MTLISARDTFEGELSVCSQYQPVTAAVWVSFGCWKDVLCMCSVKQLLIVIYLIPWFLSLNLIPANGLDLGIKVLFV
jgi:hypothetical protein